MSELIEFGSLIVSLAALGVSVYDAYKLHHQPVLLNREYPIDITDDSGEIIDSSVYSENIGENTCVVSSGSERNSICLTVDFMNVNKVAEDNNKVYVGCVVKSLPYSDWRSFIRYGYVLQFQYRCDGNVDNIHIEFTNINPKRKSYKHMLIAGHETKTFQLDMNQFRNRSNEWNSISEMCFVFFPAVDDLYGHCGKIHIDHIILKKQ